MHTAKVLHVRRDLPTNKECSFPGRCGPRAWPLFCLHNPSTSVGCCANWGDAGNRGQKVDRESSEGPGFSTRFLCSHEGSHSLKALLSSSMEGKLCVCALNLKTWKITPSHLTLKGQCGHERSKSGVQLQH